MKEIRALLNVSMSTVDSNDSCKWDEAKFPLFHFQSKLLRAMIAITLGCNIFEGVKGMGIATAYKIIYDLMTKHSDDETAVASDFKSILINTSSLDNQTLHVLLMS
jgi:hypothetical protein